VVRVIHLSRAGNNWGGGSTMSQSGGGGKVHRRRGLAAWVQGNEIEPVRKLQCVAAMPVGHWL
jgi:hypothetical protein